VAIVEGTGQKQILLHSECIVTNKKEAHELRLKRLGERLQGVIEAWEPGAIAIEKLFFNQNTSTALKVAEARGVTLYEVARRNISVYEYSPQDVKIAVTGYGKADKTAVETMTRKLVNVPEKKMFDDELDAIALCITHLATRLGI
jgi:crossover junction endodeoxyribonuclease RuvC